MNLKQIASISLIALGILSIAIPIADFIYKDKETDNYLQTTCEILQLDRIKQVRGPDKIILEYKYKVNGIIYKSSSFSNGVGNIKDFEEQYPSKKIFPLYYDPDKPTTSVLVPGGRKYLLNAPLFVGLVLIILGIIGLLSFKYKKFQEIWDTLLG